MTVPRKVPGYPTHTVFTLTNSRMPCARELAAVAGPLDAAEGQPRVALTIPLTKTAPASSRG